MTRVMHTTPRLLCKYEDGWSGRPIPNKCAGKADEGRTLSGKILFAHDRRMQQWIVPQSYDTVLVCGCALATCPCEVNIKGSFTLFLLRWIGPM